MSLSEYESYLETVELNINTYSIDKLKKINRALNAMLKLLDEIQITKSNIIINKIDDIIKNEKFKIEVNNSLLDIIRTTAISKDNHDIIIDCWITLMNIINDLENIDSLDEKETRQFHESDINNYLKYIDASFIFINMNYNKFPKNIYLNIIEKHNHIKNVFLNSIKK